MPPQQRYQPIMPQRLPDQRRLLFGNQHRRQFIGRLYDELRGLLVITEQRFDLLTQCTIAVAGLFELGPARFRLALKRPVIKLFDLLIALRLHHPSLRCNSRISQAFAMRQSRVTVSADMLKTAAVSSTLSPPK